MGQPIDNYVAKMLIGLKVGFHPIGHILFWWVLHSQEFYTMLMMKFVESEQNKEQRREIPALICGGIVHG